MLGHRSSSPTEPAPEAIPAGCPRCNALVAALRVADRGLRFSRGLCRPGYRCVRCRGLDAVRAQLSELGAK